MTQFSYMTQVFYNSYRIIGPFSSWLIGLGILCSLCSCLFVLINSWKIFFYITLIPYFIIITWSIPLTRIGSWKTLISIIHRFSGIISLLLPMGLVIYNSWTDEHSPIYLYAIACICIILNCIFGALLIPKRIPDFDIPTIRAFTVGVALGLSFVSWSLVWHFGHESWFVPWGYLSAIFSLFTCFLAWNDSIRHIYTNMTNPYYATQLDLEYFKPPKRPHEVGLKAKPYRLWEVIFKYPFKSVHPKLQQVTVTPSSAAVVFTVTLTAMFSLVTLLQWHYIYCGNNGMILRHRLFPSFTKYSTYLALLAAVANNFGTFAGTLVVQQKVSSFWGAVFNAIGLLIPVVATLTFQIRIPEENIFKSFLLTKCSL